ncbi:hypothetical protein [Acidocella facilis]|uniref:hypothetical protein n=1 Tax=Acidocella facilis TaxID=525 RepID=UPI001F24EE0F|nr:hypothetical protein [Acidocella facilis]
MDKIEAATANLAATLPDDRAALLRLARATVQKYNASILACDEVAETEANATYQAIIWKMNGGTFFGCEDSDREDAGGIVTAQHCAAEPGTIPVWGQRGEFLIVAEGVAAVVELTNSHSDSLWPHFSFHAVDNKQDFISETGYQSHFCHPQRGKHLEELATEIFAGLLRTHRRPLSREYRERAALDSWAWLHLPTKEPQGWQREEAEGQLSFGF